MPTFSADEALYVVECGTQLRWTPRLAKRAASAARRESPPRAPQASARAALWAAAADDPARAGLAAWLLACASLQLVAASSAGHRAAACSACLLLTPALSHAGRLACAAAARLGPSADFPFGLRRAHVLAGFGAALVAGALLLALAFEALESLLAPSRPRGLGGVGLAALSVCGHCAAAALDRPRRALGADDVLPGMRGAPRTALLASCTALAGAAAGHALRAACLDAAAAVAVAAVALRALVWPLLEGCALILLQATPAHLREGLASGLRAAGAVEGVLEVRERRFWALGPADCVASLHLRLRSGACERAAVAGVRAHFAGLVSSLTVEVERDEWLM